MLWSALVKGEARAKVLKQINDQLTETKDTGCRGSEIATYKQSDSFLSTEV
jgi:hypothetical protein